MGKGSRTRPFIDKKNAQTYNLVYRAAEDGVAGGAPAAAAHAASPARVLVDAAAGVRVGVPDAAAVAAAGGPVPRGPLAWLAAEAGPVGGLPAERRAELVALGFPDDGYDYAAHLRAPGAGGSATLEGGAEAATGPAVFVAAPATTLPAPDIRLDDATRLTLHEPAPDEAAAEGAAGGVTAFSRRGVAARRQAAAALAELEAVAAAAASDDDSGLDDDFVLEAAAAAAGEQGEGEAAASESEPEPWSDDGSDAARPPPSRRAGSIASTYWRPERLDRSRGLADVDEAFEALALQYDSDEIGELDDAADAGTLADPSRPGRDPAEFDAIFDEFLARNATREHAHEGGQCYAAASTLAAAGDKEAVGALRTAHAAMARARAELDAEASTASEESGEEDEVAPLARRRADSDDGDRGWDCETVLSLATGASHRPSVLGAPPRRPRRVGADGEAPPARVRLSRKTGLPLEPAAAAAPLHPPPRTPPQPARRPGETAEERTARKAAVRGAKRAAREAKAETRALFKGAEAAAARRAAAPSMHGVRIP